MLLRPQRNVDFYVGLLRGQSRKRETVLGIPVPP
jgi:hypothetical protein